jgi:hypothetical protein
MHVGDGTPVSKYQVTPPKTIISDPVHTAVCVERGDGAPAVGSGSHASRLGSYEPPVLVPGSGSQ